MRKRDPISSNLVFSGALLGALLMLGACQSKEPAPQPVARRSSSGRSADVSARAATSAIPVGVVSSPGPPA